ncbi:type II toxin-antitoxin system VapC family toxin [Methylococcus sp. BF19-07]|nr:type II toxin-antitoxin system VapC family toxin [Methylococcus sp. BF19-07]MDF9391902.1 PIN domain-containing protein [Methylococcus capsulatus]
MAAVLIDTHVIIDAASPRTEWHEWSARQLCRVVDDFGGCVNPIIYAELSAYVNDESALAALIDDFLLEKAQLLWQAAFLTGRAFVAYRRRDGNRTAPLPDFYIGAHAQVAGLRLLTRDAARYRTYFPDLQLIAPNWDPRRLP